MLTVVDSLDHCVEGGGNGVFGPSVLSVVATDSQVESKESIVWQSLRHSMSDSQLEFASMVHDSVD